MQKPVIILGVHPLGKIALDILQRNDIIVYGFLDDDQALWKQTINDIPVLGGTSENHYLDLIGEKCAVFVAVVHQAHRQRLVTVLREERQAFPINAIHPSAIIAESATLGHGNLVNAAVSLGPSTTLGSHCILHTRSTIEHDAVIQDFVQVGAGSVVGAGVRIHKQVFIGTGATVIAGVEIGTNASIGAGAVVLGNVKAGESVLGNPARVIEDISRRYQPVSET